MQKNKIIDFVQSFIVQISDNFDKFLIESQLSGDKAMKALYILWYNDNIAHLLENPKGVVFLNHPSHMYIANSRSNSVIYVNTFYPEENILQAFILSNEFHITGDNKEIIWYIEMYIRIKIFLLHQGEMKNTQIKRVKEIYRMTLVMMDASA